MGKSVKRPEGIPEEAVQMKRNILAEGELTGHFHEAVGPGASTWDTGDGTLVLDAPKGGVLTHQEHKPVAIPPQVYDREIVLENDPYLEEIRLVQD